MLTQKIIYITYKCFDILKSFVLFYYYKHILNISGKVLLKILPYRIERNGLSILPQLHVPHFQEELQPYNHRRQVWNIELLSFKKTNSNSCNRGFVSW